MIKRIEDFLIDVSMDPAHYALRLVLLAAALSLLLAVALCAPVSAAAQEKLTVKCDNGVCTIPQDQLLSLVRLIRRLGECPKGAAI